MFIMSKNTDILRIAIAQLNPVLGDIKEIWLKRVTRERMRPGKGPTSFSSRSCLSPAIRQKISC